MRRAVSCVLLIFLPCLLPTAAAAGIKDGKLSARCRAAFEQRDYPQARSVCEQGADKGEAWSQYLYYRILWEGLGRRDSAAADDLLGDRMLAFNYLVRASNQRLPEAMGALGALYLEGHEEIARRADPDLGKRLLESAARAGNEEAKQRLANLSAEYGPDLKPRYATQSEACQGHFKRMEYGEAQEACAQAARQGDAHAMLLLSGMFRIGTADRRDEKLALQLLQMAANQGLAAAQVSLGTAYQYGWQGAGLAPDAEKARTYYQVAAAQDDPEAKKLLRDLDASTSDAAAEKAAEDQMRRRLAVKSECTLAQATKRTVCRFGEYARVWLSEDELEAGKPSGDDLSLVISQPHVELPVRYLVKVEIVESDGPPERFVAQWIQGRRRTFWWDSKPQTNIADERVEEGNFNGLPATRVTFTRDDDADHRYLVRAQVMPFKGAAVIASVECPLMINLAEQTRFERDMGALRTGGVGKAADFAKEHERIRAADYARASDLADFWLDDKIDYGESFAKRLSTEGDPGLAQRVSRAPKK